MTTARPAPRREADWDDTPIPVLGQASSTVGPDPDAMLGPLWVPDPEQRHGWREYWIHPEPRPGRPMGFRKPGDR